MTNYIVHIYREMRLVFEGIEADTPEAAAAIARDKLTGDADDIESCDGETFAALVDVAGDKEYGQSRTIDFEPERQRKAAPKLLATLESVAALRRKWRSQDEAETIDSIEYMDGLDSLDFDALIAEAESSGIRSEPHDIDIHAILAKRREIAVIWCIEDVQEVRPDLTHAQCWEVLEQAEQEHNADIGISWDVLQMHASDLFGQAPDTDDAPGDGHE
jgi:hypothetical protein